MVVDECDPVAVPRLNGGRPRGPENVAVNQLANMGRPGALSLFLAGAAGLAEDARFTVPSGLFEGPEVGKGDTGELVELDQMRHSFP